MAYSNYNEMNSFISFTKYGRKTSASVFVIRDLRAGNEYISFKKRYTAVALGSKTYATVMNTQSKNKMRQAVTMLLGTGVLLSSLNSCSGLSDSTLTMLQGTGIGAAGGAAAGTGIGAAAAALAGGNSKDVKKGMIIGAIAGAVVGGVIGNRWGASVVKKKETYANVEQYINANIEQMDTRIGQANELNESLKKQIASLKEQKQKLDASSLAKLQNDVKEKISLMDTDISNATEAKQDAKGEEAKRLRQQLNDLRNIRGSITSRMNELARSYRRV